MAWCGMAWDKQWQAVVLTSDGFCHGDEGHALLLRAAHKVQLNFMPSFR